MAARLQCSFHLQNFAPGTVSGPGTNNRDQCALCNKSLLQQPFTGAVRLHDVCLHTNSWLHIMFPDLLGSQCIGWCAIAAHTRVCMCICP